jgi:AraC-like DNA-binding protein
MGQFVFSHLSETEKTLPYYLIGVGCDWEQEDIERPFGYPYFQWIQTVRGEGLLTLGGQQHRVPEQHGMFLYPEEEHAYHATDSEAGWTVHWFTFGGYHISSLLQLIDLRSSGVYPVASPHPVETVVRQGLYTLQSKHPPQGFDASVIVYSFLMQLMQHIQTESRDSRESGMRRLHPVFEYIEHHYREPISIEDLADIMDVTPQHFCHLFKEVMAERPFEFLTSYRVNKSKEILIKNPQIPISQVARRVGYDNTSYFGAVFKKVEGMSPSDFKELHGVTA